MIALAVAAFAIRSPYFGNPLIDDDEQFYLLVGDRLLRGTLPYIDIWDRKPVGLFVLFAGIRLLGGDGVLAYQLVATASVAATALLIAAMARRIAGTGPAIVAALLYIPALGLLGGQGGQTPVFYNLPMAGAAWLILTHLCSGEGRSAGGSNTTPAANAPAFAGAQLRWVGTLAMLLVGVAMQIKYNALFEGLYFGLALLWLAHREARPLATIAVDAALWIAAALAPTLIAFAAFAAIGHGTAFAYANFGSIFSREGIGHAEALHNLVHDLARLAPFLIALPFALFATKRDGYGFLIGWLAAAVIGFLIFGTYFNHYTLPLLPPLCVVVAPAFAKRRLGPILAAIALLTVAIWYQITVAKEARKRGTAAYGYAMAARIEPLLQGRCLFVFYGAPIYYHLTNSCLPTRWPFPYHLSLTREAAAMGVDPMAEMQRVLASKPAAIIDKVTPDEEVNQPVQALLRAELARDYRLVYQHRFPGGLEETDRLWARLPGR